MAPYLTDQRQKAAQARRRWFARHKYAKPPTAMAPESVLTELDSLYTELEATRVLWVGDLLASADNGHDKHRAELSDKIENIANFCPKNRLALHPSQLTDNSSCVRPCGLQHRSPP